MSAIDNATRFFHACESLEGWQGCEQFVAPGASFTAQCEPLTEISTVAEYCEWMAAIGKGPLIGCSYELIASAYDESTRTALFSGIFIAKHSGEGGPVEPTGKQTRSDYVYAITIGEDDLVTKLVKVWNAPWAMRELGWSN